MSPPPTGGEAGSAAPAPASDDRAAGDRRDRTGRRRWLRLTGRGDATRRGQLILVAAVAVAIVFVGIALVLNSAIFAENLATRQSSDASGDATAFQSAVRESVGQAMGEANRENAGDPYTALRDDHYRPAVRDLADRLAERNALEGATIDVAPVESLEGTQVADEDPGTALTPRGGTPVDWTVATGAHVRSFEVTADPTGDTTTSEVVDQVTGGDDATVVFTLTAAAGTAHRVAVYEDTNGDGDDADDVVRVLVSEVGTSSYEECAATGPAATVSLTGRPTVDGTYCEALAPVATTTGTYDVTVERGDLATGTYHLVVDRHDAGLDRAVDRANHGTACAGDTYFAGPGDDPYSVAAIYAGTVDMRYRTERVASDRTERVVPAQAGDGPTAPLFTSVDVTDDSDSSGSGQADLTVDWAVADPNGDLSTVDVTVTNLDDGNTPLDTTESVSGETDFGSNRVTESGDSGDEYLVVLAVSDGSNGRTHERRLLADDDGTGCQP